MQILSGLPNPPLAQPSAITIGNFDGIHRGHQALLRLLMDDARARGWLAGLMTFDPHPVSVLHPEADQRYLTSLAERLALIEALGLDFAVIYPFSPHTARTPAQLFMKQMYATLNLAALWVGPDFALGRNREGDVEALRQYGDEFGFRVNVIMPQVLAGDEVRSGRIREHLLAGEVMEAGDKLGRLYRVSGVVVRGAQRGRAIGFPTANIALPEQRLVPADGVYATWVDIQDGEGELTWDLGIPIPSTKDARQAGPVGAAGHERARRFAAVTNIGVRPSFDNGQRTVEAHLLDFHGDLYGRTLTVHFVRRLRSEIRFQSVDELVTQIHQDAERARRILWQRRDSG